MSQVVPRLQYLAIGAGRAQPGEEACASPLELLPHGLICMIGHTLPTQSRVSLRETCRALAAALAGAFDAVSVDVRLFESGGAAAAASLARACPTAQRAVVKLWLHFSKPPSEASLGRLFTTLASTKPQLESLDIEWVQHISVYFQRRLAECRRPSMNGAEALCAAPVARAAAAALACAGCGLRLRQLALMPAALGGTGAGPDAPRDSATSGVALLSRLPQLRQVVAREADPTRGPGVSPAGLSELGCISGLESHSVDLWTGDVAEDALQAWRALNSFAVSPAAGSLTNLQIRCAGVNAIQVHWSWLLGFPRLRRLELGRSVSIDLSDLSRQGLAKELAAAAAVVTSPAGRLGTESASPADGAGRSSGAEAAAGAAMEGVAEKRAAATVVAALPPLEHLALDQPELDSASWWALADGQLLGRTLTSLQLWRCGAPPEGIAPQPHRAGPAAARAVAGHPFRALRKLHLGTGDETDAALKLASALSRLEDLSLDTANRAIFRSGDLPRLSALTRLTRLVMTAPCGMTLKDGVRVEQGAQGPRAATAELSLLKAQLPLLQFYKGPIPECDAATDQG